MNDIEKQVEEFEKKFSVKIEQSHEKNNEWTCKGIDYPFMIHESSLEGLLTHLKLIGG